MKKSILVLAIVAFGSFAVVSCGGAKEAAQEAVENTEEAVEEAEAAATEAGETMEAVVEEAEAATEEAAESV